MNYLEQWNHSNSQEFSFSDPSGRSVDSRIISDIVRIKMVIHKHDNLNELSKEIDNL